MQDEKNIPYNIYKHFPDAAKDKKIQWFLNGKNRDNIFLSGGYLLSLLHSSIKFESNDIDIFSARNRHTGTSRHEVPKTIEINNIVFSISQFNTIYILKDHSIGNIYEAKIFDKKFQYIERDGNSDSTLMYERLFDSFDIKNCQLFLTPSGEIIGNGIDLLDSDIIELNSKNQKEARGLHITHGRMMKYATRGFKIRERDLFNLTEALPKHIFYNSRTDANRYWHNVYIGWMIEAGLLNPEAMVKKKVFSTAWEEIDQNIIQPIHMINALAAWANEKDKIKII